MNITSITVSRLFNTGNYNHERYEITADVGDSNPSEVFQKLHKALDDLNPSDGPDMHQVEEALRILAKPAGDLDQWEAKNVDTYKATIAAHEAVKARRAAALAKLGAQS